MCIRDSSTTVNAVKHQVNNDREQLTERQQREFSDLRDEMNRLRAFPNILAGLPHLDGREHIDFRAYIKNPLEFLERVDEVLNRNRENRWSVIKGMLDEYFRNVFDNWWTATRHEVDNYAAFKVAFKLKYWSESTQNIIRDDITNGRYDPNGRQSMTTYFLGKICLARNLEPAIPEAVSYTHLDVYKRQS